MRPDGKVDVGGVVLLADLLVIPIGGRYPPLTMAPEARRARTLRGLAAQLVALSQRRP